MKNSWHTPALNSMSLYYVLSQQTSQVYPDVSCILCTSPLWAPQCANYTVTSCSVFYTASPLVHICVWHICCMAKKEDGITRICTKRCSSDHYIYNGDRRECSSNFHRCPGEMNNQTAHTAHSVFRKLHQGQIQPGTEMGCTSHCSPTRSYTVWPQSLMDESCTHAQVSQAQFRSKGLQHISYSLWVQQSMRMSHWWRCKNHKTDTLLDQPG